MLTRFRLVRHEQKRKEIKAGTSMNKSSVFQYVSFPTTAEAMSMEETSLKVGLAGKLVPIPRQLSAGCGIAWKSSASQDLLESHMTQYDIEWEKIVSL